MNKICFIVCYSGTWPSWFDAFLLSCRWNPNVDWLFFTDCKIPEKYPSNVKFIEFSLNEFSSLASEKLGFNVTLTKPYKFCDFKITMGCIFEDYLTEYDFWGMCDIDVIFGDIRKFITEKMLNENDIISSRINNISGHFNLFRNKFEINNIFRKIRKLKPHLKTMDHKNISEIKISNLLKNSDHNYRIKWDECLLNFSKKFLRENPYYEEHPGRLPDDYKCKWDTGKLYYENEEIMYLHFMGWQRTDSIKNCTISYSEELQNFVIEKSGII